MKPLDNQILLIVLLLLALPYKTLSAQTPRPVLEMLADQAETLLDLDLSPKGRYALIFKSYENKESTMTISDIKPPFRKIIKSGVSKYFFVADDVLIIQKGSKAYRLNLLTEEETEISNVQNIGFIERSGLLLIHFDKTRNNELEIYDQDFRVKQKIQDVSRWTITNDEALVLVKADQEKKILKLSKDGRSTKEIWSSHKDIYSVAKADMQVGGYIVTVTIPQGLQTWWTDGNGNRIELTDALLKPYDHIIINKSSDPKAVFLTLSKRIAQESQLVSVWYGNEQDLKKYTQGEKMLTHLLWYPLENRINILDTNYRGYSAVGRSGNFLKVKIDKTKSDVMEGFHGTNKDDVYLRNSITGKEILLDKDMGFLYIDEAGKYLLLRGEEQWLLLNTKNLKITPIHIPKEAVPYFTPDQTIIWCVKGEIWEQDLIRLTKKNLIHIPWADHLEIVNRTKESTDAGIDRVFHYIQRRDHLLICAKNKSMNKVSYISLNATTKRDIVSETNDRIKNFKFTRKGDQYIWAQENFNKLPQVILSAPTQSETIIDSLNKLDNKAIQIKKIIVEYKGSNNEDLKASIFFPSDFDPEKKYPVVLSIYEEQQEFTNKFLLATMKNTRGINVRLLLESGYIVMLPDITYGDQGPGLSALLCINNALDALSEISQTDMKRVGLIGQSFGGYETNFIAAHTDRFAAFISGASVSDIIHTSYSFNYNFQSPDYWRYEEGQFRMKDSFVHNSKKYFDNNPLYQASKVKAPILLWTGTADKNVDQEETRTLFNVLRKYKRPVIALFYEDEGHSLAKKDAQKDFSLRVLDWLDFFLQGKKEIPWINKQMKDAL
ncbi:MAG: alpha/beta hydrolase family protein [Chryseobacterium culicis]